MRASAQQLPPPLHHDAVGDAAVGRGIRLTAIWRPSRKMLVQLIAVTLYCMAMTGALTGVAEYNVEIRGTLYGAAGDGGNSRARNEVVATISGEEGPKKAALPSPITAVGAGDAAALGSPAPATPASEGAGSNRSVVAETTIAVAPPTIDRPPQRGAGPAPKAPIETESSPPATRGAPPVIMPPPPPQTSAAMPKDETTARALIKRLAHPPQLRKSRPPRRPHHVSRRRHYRRAGGWRRETARAW